MRARNFALVATLGLFAATPSLVAATISVLPVLTTVKAGQSFNLNVKIAGATDLYGYQFDLGFNPAILSATSVTEGAFLGTGGSTIFLPGTIDNVGGSITANADILDGAVSGVNGSGDLFDITFQALTAGSSSVNLFNLFALNSFGQGLSATVANASVTVQPAGVPTAPEPTSVVLLATGLIALLAFGKLRASPSPSS